jgi:thiamine-phosphate pyrophosphorylase
MMAWRGRSDRAALERTARTLGRRRRRGKRLPTLWLVTDPARVGDPVAAARSLPRGAGVIYRAFGAADAVTTGRALAAVARTRGLILLVGADAVLAAAVGAHGLHLPERQVTRAPRLRARHPGWLLTGAAHDRAALARAGRAGLDAVLLSAVFPSRSPSAGPPLGPVRFARLAHDSGRPVIALGGVNGRTAPRLLDTGAAGLAAVEAPA